MKSIYMHSSSDIHAESTSCTFKERRVILRLTCVLVVLFGVCFAGGAAMAGHMVSDVIYNDNNNPVGVSVRWSLDGSEDKYPDSITVPDSVGDLPVLYADFRQIPRVWAKIGSAGAKAVGRSQIFNPNPTDPAICCTDPDYPDIALLYRFSLTENTPTYLQEPSGLCACAYRKDLTIADIPDGVTSIEWGVGSGFADCKSLEKVTVPEGVKFIGSSSFSNCTSLKEVKLPDSLETLQWAFADLTDLEIDLPDNIKSYSYDYGRAPRMFSHLGTETAKSLSRANVPFSLRDNPDLKLLYSLDSDGNFQELYAFAFNKDMVVANIPEGVTAIDWFVGSAFSGCKSLEKVTIPEGVKYISSSSFGNCTSLKEVKLPNSLETLQWAFADLADLEIDLPDNITSYSYDYGRAPRMFARIGSETAKSISRVGSTFMVRGYTGVKLKYIFDSDGNVDGLTARAVSSDIVEAVVPEGVTIIESDAFNFCRELTTLKLPESLEALHAQLEYCYALTDVDLPDNITVYTRDHNGSIRLNTRIDTVTAMTLSRNYRTFSLRGNPNVRLKYSFDDEDGSVTGLEASADNGEIVEAIIPEGVTVLRSYAFPNKKALVEVRIPDSVTSIESGAFYGSGNVHLTLSSESPVRRFPRYSYDYTYIYPEMLVLPTGLTEIKEDAFAGSDIVAVYLPETCERIGSRAFADCPNLISVHFPGDSVEIDPKAFEGSNVKRFFTNPESDAAAFADAHGIPHYYD